jgi:hypothetical protein
LKTVLQNQNEGVINELKEFSASSSKPLEMASKLATENLEQMGTKTAEIMEQSATKLSKDIERLSAGATNIVKSFEKLEKKFEALQTPEKIIEIELRPIGNLFIEAIEQFRKDTERNVRAMADAGQGNQKVADSLSQAVAAARDVAVGLHETKEVLASIVETGATVVRDRNAVGSGLIPEAPSEQLSQNKTGGFGESIGESRPRSASSELRPEGDGGLRHRGWLTGLWGR